MGEVDGLDWKLLTIVGKVEPILRKTWGGNTPTASIQIVPYDVISGIGDGDVGQGFEVEIGSRGRCCLLPYSTLAFHSLTDRNRVMIGPKQFSIRLGMG